VTDVFDKLVEGWVAGEGSPKFKTQRLRIIEGGLDGEQRMIASENEMLTRFVLLAVWPSLELMQKGDYAREKLVIRL